MNPPSSFDSPTIRRAIEELAIVESQHRFKDTLLAEESARIVNGIPYLELWLAKSDALVRDLPGAKRLRARREFGRLRHTSGSLLGLPFFLPPLLATAAAPEPRVRFLRDELTDVMLPGRIEGIWRPIKDLLTFDDARALADMKAGTLYRLTSKGLVPGLIRRNLATDPRSRTAELVFDTIEFMRWTAVVRVEWRAFLRN